MLNRHWEYLVCGVHPRQTYFDCTIKSLFEINDETWLETRTDLSKYVGREDINVTSLTLLRKPHPLVRLWRWCFG